MHPSRAGIVRAARVLLLALGAWIVHETPASAQYGYGGYGGMGYGGMGYGGYGGMGYGGMGYGGMGYGGMGYGGYGGMGYGGGYGGYGGGYGGYGYGGGGFGYPGSGFGTLYPSSALGGVGFPGTSWQNPYFSFGLSPLAVQNAVFERTVLGRTTPPFRSSQVTAPMPVATPPPTATSGQVGMGTFSNRQ